MKRWIAKTARWWFVAVAAVLVGSLSMGAVQSRQDEEKVARMTERMKTVCVGRFLIDVPEEMQVLLSDAFVDGFHIATHVEGEQEFLQHVATREAEINSKPNELGKKNMESTQAVRTGGFNGKIFIFGRTRDYRVENGRRIYDDNVAMEAYIHSGDTSFSLTTDGYDPDLAANLGRLIKKFTVLLPSEIPNEPGFCIDRALIRDPLTADQHEGVTMFAGLPGHPDLALVFSSMAGTRPQDGLLARDAAATAHMPFFARAAFRTIREGKRTINGLPGEELAAKATELNFTTGFDFEWEMAGKQGDVYAPLLTLEMQTGINPRSGGKPVQSSLAQAALVELWDRISSSIRIRPAAQPKPARADPGPPPLGTNASAGETCPQTGWWQCSDGGRGVGVLGGQRQFLKKGQRMPQALLLPPQTLWQKVRGLQSSYESAAPTAWRLVDKRARKRLAPDVPLLPATVVDRADAAAVGAGGAGTPGAQVGSFVKTGEACPASGWWRCDEPRALDGTRWFSQGSVLPAATFQIPAGGFARTRFDVIHRRSTWQLVRRAQALDAAAVGDGDKLADAGEAPDPPTSAA